MAVIINLITSFEVPHPYLFFPPVALITIFIWLYLYTIKQSSPPIPKLPKLPGSVAIWGNLKQMGDDHSTSLQNLSLKYKMPVFQCYFGTQRMVFINSYSTAYEWFIKNQTALIDRPVFYTFHKLVSTSQGLTIGTSPWNDTCRKRRLNVQRYMTTPAIQERAGLIDVECFSLLRDLYSNTSVKGKYVYPYHYTQRFALNFTTMLSYATRFDNIGTPLLTEILDMVKVISSFRSTNNNLQDFVPFVRLLPENKRKQEAVACSNKRNVWLNRLTQEAVDHKDQRASFVGEFANSGGVGRLNIDDVKCICVGLVSGGFETIGSTASLIMAQLSTEKGDLWQQRVYDELMEVYGSAEVAYKKVLLEEKSKFAVSFLRELLRMYAVIPLIPARKTAKAFTWEGVDIPEGVTVILNAQAANHDKSHFGGDADEFVPDRFLKDKNADIPPYHFTFGAGSRACTAVNLSNRILYAILARTCLLFKVKGEKGNMPNVDYIDYAEDRKAQTFWIKPFGMSLEARDEKLVELCLNISKDACTEELSYSIEYN